MTDNTIIRLSDPEEEDEMQILEESDWEGGAIIGILAGLGVFGIVLGVLYVSLGGLWR